MNVRKLGTFIVLMAMFLVPSMLFAHPAVQLLDKNGNPVVGQLNKADNITAANGSVYYSGPEYSPKQTCGKCHDYNSITKAYHFREGTGPKAENVDDHWSAKNSSGTLYKYLANAYGHLESPGQFGAW